MWRDPGSGDGGQEGSATPEVVIQIGANKLDAKIREIMHDEVATLFQAQLPEMFVSIKTTMVEYFDERYTALAETAAATVASAVTTARGGSSQAF